MIEIKARITDISKSVFSNKSKITLEFEGNPADFDNLIEKDLRVSLKVWRNRRSRDANSYFWELCNQLAYELRKSAIDIYRGYIKEVPNNRFMGCVAEKDVAQAKAMWESRGTGWIAVPEDSRRKGCKNMTYYYGSSMYDTVQMNVLIDLVKQDCEAVGIPTMTPNEIAEMMARWGNEI